LTGGPAEARHKKKIVETDAVKISNNFGAMLQRRYPSPYGVEGRHHPVR
jgi:hypothetical protein